MQIDMSMTTETESKQLFNGSISIFLSAISRRVRIELSDAQLHGGDKGFYRIRLDRRWVNAPNNEKLFFNKNKLSNYISGLFFGTDEVDELPNWKSGDRVSVKFFHNKSLVHERVFINTPPIRAYNGIVYIGVRTFRTGFIFLPIKYVTYLEGDN